MMQGEPIRLSNSPCSRLEHTWLVPVARQYSTSLLMLTSRNSNQVLDYGFVVSVPAEKHTTTYGAEQPHVNSLNPISCSYI